MQETVGDRGCEVACASQYVVHMGLGDTRNPGQVPFRHVSRMNPFAKQSQQTRMKQAEVYEF